MGAGKHWTMEGGTTRVNRRKPVRLVLVCVGIALLAGIGYGVFLAQPDKDPAPASKVVAKSEEKPQYNAAKGRYLMNGTIFWGRAIEKWSAQPGGGYDYARPFSALDTFNPDQYDAWVADLECPVLDTVIPYDTQVATLQFNCRPEYLTEAAKYFDIIDLANNHSGDKGEDGFQETRRRVTEAGMQAYGNYDPGVEQDRCEVVSLPIRLQQSGGQEKDAAIPVAFCAYHYFGRMPRADELEYMKQYSKVMPVFAFVHMGTEYLTQANAYQVEVAHKVIEQGVEFVVLNNPHWVQNTEVYNGKLIFYSTGNFIFDQVDKEGMRSASLDVAIETPYNDNLAKWLELNESCDAKKLHDACFAQAKQQSLAKPKLQLIYDVVAGDNSGKLTKRANATIQREVEQRTNWAETLQKLGQN